MHSTLIYGAGGGGKLVLRELHQNRELHLDPVGFIDDDPAKQRLRVDGIPVLGTSDDLEAVASRMSVADLIISVREIEAARIDDIRRRCGGDWGQGAPDAIQHRRAAIDADRRAAGDDSVRSDRRPRWLAAAGAISSHAGIRWPVRFTGADQENFLVSAELLAS